MHKQIIKTNNGFISILLPIAGSLVIVAVLAGVVVVHNSSKQSELKPAVVAEASPTVLVQSTANNLAESTATSEPTNYSYYYEENATGSLGSVAVEETVWSNVDPVISDNDSLKHGSSTDSDSSGEESSEEDD